MTCRHHDGRGCSLGLYGGRPSPGVCKICPRYQEPAKPPLVPKVEPKPVPKKKGLLSKAVSYAKAEASLLVQGPVGDDQYQARVAECLKCPHLKKSEEPGQVGWCKACGCGSSARAELTVKARMPKAKCPVNSWPEGDTKER